MENNRVTAYKVLLGIYRDNKYSNLALKKILFDIKSEDQNFVRELVYGVLENQYLLDYNLERFLRKPLESHKLSEKIILRMGVYQIGFMKGVTDRVPGRLVYFGGDRGQLADWHRAGNS